MTQIKVLILEDEFLIAQDILEILEGKESYELQMANSYKEALLISNSWMPNLLLCDINLEGKKKGTHFAQQLKRANPNLKVIFITALKDPKTIQEAKKCCPDNFLIKPFEKHQLLITIEIALNKNQTSSKNIKSTELLSGSESKIVQLISLGHNSQEIGNTLNISEKTVRNHRYNIAKKLNLPKENNSLLKWALTNLS